jgi:hypothetical protein
VLSTSKRKIVCAAFVMRTVYAAHATENLGRRLNSRG